jgi:hypothetical protein
MLLITLLKSSATGGTVLASGNSDNKVTSTNGQSESQGQSSSTTTATSTATSTSNDQGQSQDAHNSQTQSASSGVTNAGNSTASQATTQSNAGNNTQTTVSINQAAQARNPASTAYAAPLTAGVDTCMGSTSVGGQGITFGFSAASTWTDRNCVRLKNSRELNAMGMTQVACELLAEDKDVAEAMRKAGGSCVPVKAVIAAALVVPVTPSVPTTPTAAPSPVIVPFTTAKIHE